MVGYRAHRRPPKRHRADVKWWNMFAAAVRDVNKRGRPSNVAKLWALRWRRRWGGRVGKLRAGDVTTLGDSRQKASTFLSVVVCCMDE